MRRLLCVTLLLSGFRLLAASGTFVFEGDSITAGTVNTEGHKLHQEAAPLSFFLTMATITNVASSGYTLAAITSEYATRVGKFDADPAPKYCWVMIGVNDALPFANTNTWITGLTNYWATVHSHGFKVIASTITVSYYDYDDYLILLEVNDMIRYLSPQADYLVDTAALFPDPDDPTMYNGVHLTDLAIAILATNINATLQPEIPGPATVHYVDVAATRGFTNGTSWANAWTTLYACHDSSNNVVAGDTVFVRGGDYVTDRDSEHGGEPLRLESGSGGTWTKYYFTNGVSKFYCKFMLKNYTLLNGASNPNYATNIGNDTYRVPLITNNCNLWIYRFTNWYDVGSSGRSIVVQSSPVDMSWLRVTGATNRYAEDEGGVSDSASEIFFDLASVTGTNEVGYVWTEHSSGNGAGAVIAPYGGDGTKAGIYNIHHCLFEKVGSDLVTMSPGVDYHHNVSRDREGHPNMACNDTFFGGPFENVRIHHNLIEPTDNDLFSAWYGATDKSNFWFYCNILMPPVVPVQTTRGNAGFGQASIMGATNMVHVRTNVVFANNTLIAPAYDHPTGLTTLSSRSDGGKTYSFTIDTGAWVSKNNLIARTSTTNAGDVLAPFGFNPDLTGDGYGWFFDTNSIVLDYNLFVDYYTNNLRVGAWGQSGDSKVTLTNASDISTVMGYTHNQSLWNTAILKDADGFNFRPASLTVNIGENLTSLTNVMPDLDLDIYGIRRPATGAWAAGAIEYTDLTNGLLLWLTFDAVDFVTNGATGTITDHSGLTNNAQLFSYAGWAGGTTWPWPTNGPSDVSAAWFVTNYHDGSYQYGTYSGVTNFNGGLDVMTNGTWALWASDDLTKGTTYHSWLNCGYSPTNTWRFFATYYDNVEAPAFGQTSASGGEANLEVLAQFPTLTDTSWKHYAVTWDGTTVIGYLNGLPYCTNAYSGLLVSTNDNPNPAASWIGIGVATHNGTYLRTDADELPNHGQMYGGLADIRIYNRAVTPQEVQAIYQYSGADLPEEPATVTNRVYVTGTVRAGQVRRP